MVIDQAKPAVVARGIGALFVVVACLAITFIAVPFTVASATELPDTFVWWYLLVMVVTFAGCVIAGWRLILDGSRPILGFALLFGSVVFFGPYLIWFLKALGNAIGEG
jgi:hypothetical protein